MTRKDYVLIAKAINSAYGEGAHIPTKNKTTWDDALGNAVYYLAIHLEGDNAAFDRNRFAKACRGEK